MRIIVISLLLLFTISCKGSPLSTKEKPDYALGWNFIYYALIKPEQDRQASCARPDAIRENTCGKCSCNSNKVSEGLIFDANTNIAISAETITPGQSFLCQCGKNFKYSSWNKAISPQDSISNPILYSYIFSNSSNPAYNGGKNSPIIYKTHYNQLDNLYCIAYCPIDENYNYQYQILKIR